MNLRELITALEAEDPRKVVPHGFGEPHCWRWDYSGLAFDPAQNVTVGSMLAHARSAVGTTYQGWKGGDYTMDLDTDCCLATRREVGETLGPTLLRLMLAAGTIPGETPPATPQAPAAPDQELRATAAKLRAMVDAARDDLRTSTYYDHDEANYTSGINNATGGAAGQLAASFTPAAADLTAAWLERSADDYASTARAAARWPEPVTDVETLLAWCEEETSVRLALDFARTWSGTAAAPAETGRA